MLGINIYVFADDHYDRSRWLRLSGLDGQRVLLELSDLCQPGKVSQIAQLALDIPAFQQLMRNGAVQATLGRGYVLLRSAEDLLHVEFKSNEDSFVSRATLKRADVMERFDSIVGQTLKAG